MNFQVKNTKENIDDIEDYIEIDIEKQIDNLKEENKAKNNLTFEKFQAKNDIAPLYIHDVFKHKEEKKHSLLGFQTQNLRKTSKENITNVNNSIFLVEKLEKQILETRQKKIEMKMMKKNLSNSEKKPAEIFSRTGKEGTEEVFIH